MKTNLELEHEAKIFVQDYIFADGEEATDYSPQLQALYSATCKTLFAMTVQLQQERMNGSKVEEEAREWED